jgi:hypothetical protein
MNDEAVDLVLVRMHQDGTTASARVIDRVAPVFQHWRCTGHGTSGQRRWDDFEWPLSHGELPQFTARRVRTIRAPVSGVQGDEPGGGARPPSPHRPRWWLGSTLTLVSNPDGAQLRTTFVNLPICGNTSPLTRLRHPAELGCRAGFRASVAEAQHRQLRLAAAAEAAGPAVSEVFLTVRSGGSRSGYKRGKGQSEGQNDLRHDGLLWLLLVAGRMAARSSVPGVRQHMAGCLRVNPNGKLAAELQLVLNLFGDFLEICGDGAVNGSPTGQQSDAHATGQVPAAADAAATDIRHSRPPFRQNCKRMCVPMTCLGTVAESAQGKEGNAARLCDVCNPSGGVRRHSVPLSFRKIPSARIRAMRQNQRIILRDACIPSAAWNVCRQPVQVAAPA